MYGPLYSFSNTDLLNFLKGFGVELKVERGGRVFPRSDSSRDIVEAFKKYLEQGKVKVITGVNVSNVLVNESNKVSGVLLSDGRSFYADRVIIATGGLSFPGTGSTGDGYTWAQNLGHNIVSLRPSLIPLEVEETWIKELQGLSLKNVAITIKTNKEKIIAEAFGEMLFTHYGVSGPIILTVSRYAVDYWLKNSQPLILSIDLKPALSWEQLDQRLIREIEKFSNKFFKNSLNELLPNKLIPVIIAKSKIPPDKKMNQVTKEERQSIIKALKALEFNLIRPRPVTEAIVTRGGVDLKEVNPKTMESKLVKGLYFVGEVLDIDGNTGGYNLQAAFSTGFVAGEAAAKV